MIILGYIFVLSQLVNIRVLERIDDKILEIDELMKELNDEKV